MPIPQSHPAISQAKSLGARKSGTRPPWTRTQRIRTHQSALPKNGNKKTGVALSPHQSIAVVLDHVKDAIRRSSRASPHSTVGRGGGDVRYGTGEASTIQLRVLRTTREGYQTVRGSDIHIAESPAGMTAPTALYCTASSRTFGGSGCAPLLNLPHRVSERSDDRSSGWGTRRYNRVYPKSKPDFKSEGASCSCHQSACLPDTANTETPVCQHTYLKTYEVAPLPVRLHTVAATIAQLDKYASPNFVRSH